MASEEFTTIFKEFAGIQDVPDVGHHIIICSYFVICIL